MTDVVLSPLENSNALLCATAPKNTAKWTEDRRNCVCASEVSALLGLGGKRTRAQVLKEKNGELPKPFTDYEMKMLCWGTEHENDGITEVQKLYSSTCGPVVKLGSLIHRNHQELQGEPDGIMVDPRSGRFIPIEVKCRCYPTTSLALPYASVSEIPQKHWIQLQIYMELLDSEWGVLVNWTVNGSTMFWFARDKTFFETIVVPLLKKFKLGTLESRIPRLEKQFTMEYLDTVWACLDAPSNFI